MFIPFIIELPVPFDVLDAAVNEFLPGYIRGWVKMSRKEMSHGSVVYELWQNQLGDLGKIKLRKKADEISELNVNRPPKPTDEEFLEYEKLTKPGISEMTSQISQGVVGEYPGYLLRAIYLNEVIDSQDIAVELREDKKSSTGKVLHIAWPSDYSQETRREKFSLARKNRESSREKLYDKRKEHLGKVVNVLFERLEQDDIFVPNESKTSLNDPALSSEEINYRNELLDIIKQRFNEGELKELYFRLGRDYGEFEFGGTNVQSQALVEYCFQHKKVTELTEAISQIHPEITLSIPPS